jgi:hypothetical protein
MGGSLGEQKSKENIMVMETTSGEPSGMVASRGGSPREGAKILEASRIKWTCADIRPCLWPRFGILGLQKPLVAGFLVWLKNTGMLNATGSFEVEGTWYHRDFIKARKVMKVMCPSNEIYYYLTILPLSGCVS